jgi:hypothetical protein
MIQKSVRKKSVRNSCKLSARKKSAINSRKLSARKKSARNSRKPSALKKSAINSRKPSALKKSAINSRKPSARKKSARNSRKPSALKKSARNSRKPSALKKSAINSRKLSARKKSARNSRKLSALKKSAINSRKLSARKKSARNSRKPSARKKSARNSRKPSARKKSVRNSRKPSARKKSVRNSRKPSARKKSIRHSRRKKSVINNIRSYKLKGGVYTPPENNTKMHDKGGKEMKMRRHSSKENVSLKNREITRNKSRGFSSESDSTDMDSSRSSSIESDSTDMDSEHTDMDSTRSSSIESEKEVMEQRIKNIEESIKNMKDMEDSIMLLKDSIDIYIDHVTTPNNEKAIYKLRNIIILTILIKIIENISNRINIATQICQFTKISKDITYIEGVNKMKELNYDIISTEIEKCKQTIKIKKDEIYKKAFEEFKKEEEKQKIVAEIKKINELYSMISSSTLDFDDTNEETQNFIKQVTNILAKIRWEEEYTKYLDDSVKGCEAYEKINIMNKFLELLKNRQKNYKTYTKLKEFKKLKKDFEWYTNPYVPVPVTKHGYVNKTKNIISRSNIETYYDKDEDNLHCSARTTQLAEIGDMSKRNYIHSTLHKNKRTGLKDKMIDYHYGIEPNKRDYKNTKVITGRWLWSKANDEFPSQDLPKFAYTTKEIFDGEMLSGPITKENYDILSKPLEQILRDKYNKCKTDIPKDIGVHINSNTNDGSYDNVEVQYL